MINDSTKDFTPLEVSYMKGIASIQKFLIKQNAKVAPRIAISKTLTELSGASSIGFLAFDEVFGSQDEARRMEILEAFHTIKEQYRQIFLISHEMEIKEMFEWVVEL